MKHELLVMFIISRADELNDSILSVVTEQNETEKRYCIIHIFLIVTHSSETTNITIAVTPQLGFHNVVRMCACVCVCMFVCMFVCEISEKKDAQTKES